MGRLIYMTTGALPLRHAIAVLMAILMLGAAVRLALVEIADGDLIPRQCRIESDFWHGDLILC